MSKYLLSISLLLCSTGFSFAQSEMIQTRRIVVDPYFFMQPHKSVGFYSKVDSPALSLKVSIPVQIKGELQGVGDILFFVDSLGGKKIKLANIEIRKNTGRFYDWRTFIIPSQYNDYDIYHDVGIGIDQLDETDMFYQTRAIARAMLEELERSIIFLPVKHSGTRIVYSYFTF